MATYRVRGKSVQVQIRLHGVKDTATFPSKGMAKVWASRREAEIVAGARGMIVTGNSVAEMIDRYIREVCPTLKGGHWDELRLKLYRREWNLAGKRVETISSDDIAKLRDYRLLSVSPPSVRREMVLLATVFETARKEWKWCAINPVRDVRKPPDSKDRQRLVTRAEYRAILKRSGYRPGKVPTTKTQWAVCAWCLALRTGMRAGELMKLEWGHISGNVAKLTDTKNGTDRQVPLFPRALRILRGIQPQQFLAGHGDTAHEERIFHQLNSHTLDALFRKVRDAANINGLTFHDSRHVAVTMFARFLPVLELARTIGHNDLNSLLRYYNTSAAAIAGRVGPKIL